MLACSYSWGKNWHKNWLAGSFSVPFVTLPLKPNCMSIPCPLWCLPVRDRPQVTSPWSALAAQALIKLGWRMGAPVLEMPARGCPGNVPWLYFLGGIWCLKLRNMENKDWVLPFLKTQSSKGLFWVPSWRNSFAARPLLPLAVNPVSEWPDELKRAVCRRRPRLSCFCLLGSLFPPDVHFKGVIILFPWFAALGRSEWNVQLRASFLKGGVILLERSPPWAWPRPWICVQWTKDLVGCQLRQNFK